MCSSHSYALLASTRDIDSWSDLRRWTAAKLAQIAGAAKVFNQHGLAWHVARARRAATQLSQAASRQATTTNA